jgi:23S rRNA (guanosine2251-2'-O)-methyltransferase
MKKEESRFADSVLFEGMTSIRACIRAMEETLHDRRILRILYDRDKADSKRKELGWLRAMGQKYGFPLEETDSAYLDSVTVGASHGGIIAVCSDRTIPSLMPDALKPDGFYVLIEGIEDPYNFGYSLRSLYACGCNGILLPMRNWMSAAGVVCRSSAGASELLPMWTAEAEDIVKIFKQKGYQIVCAHEKTENVLGKCELKLPILLLVGGEKRGVSASVLAHADTLVRIDYKREFRASLSAASATTIFAYEIARQNS